VRPGVVWEALNAHGDVCELGGGDFWESNFGGVDGGCGKYGGYLDAPTYISE
jgi:hypothetical protein